ncbi:hypothetical protein MKEN_00152900 [Mycena kentingensis (nom. inval.)]|nr:hypothetical protein MKEN_00152900 [Mycena kentingensis (nom. inval.)]
MNKMCDGKVPQTDAKAPADASLQSSSSSSQPRRRSFLSTAFGHGRSRSADIRDAPPPSYNSIQAAPGNKLTKFAPPGWKRKQPSKIAFESGLDMLRKYDTVILMDDSGSMVLPGSKKGRTRWSEAGEALETLAETAQQYDTDGIDIYFLNNPCEALNVKSSQDVRNLFHRPRLCLLEAAHIDPDGTPRDVATGEEIKRVNIIVITDGAASDDPKYPIIEAATRLQAMRNLCLIQLGIQFVQIGNDPGATRALKELDNDLHRTANIRDIVDTTPYTKLSPITAEGLMKVLLGGINRRIDQLYG